ncbi:MAG: hypothetical protein LBP68_04710 [Acidobacteriota bacterium]|nr:hypothetical protein [Acidobacteriota bacterium]
MATELATVNSFHMFEDIPGDDRLPIQPEIRVLSIASDLTFRSILRKGSWEAMWQYVETHQENIRDILYKRLRVTITPEAAMVPEGRVQERNNAEFPSGGIEYNFTLGRDALRTGDFAQAARHFERSAAVSTGTNRATAENHWAYALILQGETLRARMMLSPLVASRCPFPSSYWNLTCSMTEEQGEGQLAVLSAGIGKAPHVRLLHGAIALGLRLGHRSLAEWLASLPLLEAQLLATHLTCASTSPTERETALLRIGNYVYDGEPEIPDPLEHILAPVVVKRFFQAMMQRQRHAAPVDFWFRCRRRIAFMRYDFWKIKADYHEQFGRRNKAVNAFKTELYCRLSALTSKPQFRANLQFLEATRTRVGIYICRCMTPELRTQGRAIHRMISRFEDDYGISLLPANLSLQKLYEER